MRKLLLLTLLSLTGCAAHKAMAAPQLAPLQFEAAVTPTPPAPLDVNHFRRDQPAGSLGEPELKQILEAPVFLEANARIGVVPVASHYELDGDLPGATPPARLTEALESSGMFDLATEVSTDWPADRGTAGLRELAARYRADYLMLYRHRFVDDASTNGLAVFYALGLPALFVPGQRIEAAGVLEATLFDVRTGTLLFTVQERVRGEELAAPPSAPRKAEALKRRLLDQAAQRLNDTVVSRCRRLEASRPHDPNAPVKISAQP